jgi:hypothetical protein
LGPEDDPDPSAIVGWEIQGCPEQIIECDPIVPDICGTTAPLPACTYVETYTTAPGVADVPCAASINMAGDLAVVDITECSGSYSTIIDNEDLATYGYDRSSASLVQVLADVPRGMYLLSWFDTTDNTSGSNPYLITVDVPGWEEGTWEQAYSQQYSAVNTSWMVRIVVLGVDGETDIRISIDPSDELAGNMWGRVTIASLSLILEDFFEEMDTYCAVGYDNAIEGCSLTTTMFPVFFPGTFERTSASRLKPSMCLDSDGRGLRDTFAYNCDFTCSDGFSDQPCSSIDDGAVAQRCYYALPFHLALEGIENGEVLTSGAISIGNFNYRHVGVSANVVGTNVIDCTEAEFPSTCYSNAFLEYSMRHSGSFDIRNYYGDVAHYYLPDAWIEHQKALTGEVVLTNPPSSTQQSLLAEYRNTELWGRPLTGDFVLKIWDRDGLVWENIEDIQIVFDYHYWTRHSY